MSDSENSTPFVRWHDVETCDCEVCTAVRGGPPVSEGNTNE